MPDGFEIEITSRRGGLWTGSYDVTTGTGLPEAIRDALDGFLDSELAEGHNNPDRIVIVVTPRG